MAYFSTGVIVATARVGHFALIVVDTRAGDDERSREVVLEDPHVPLTKGLMSKRHSLLEHSAFGVTPCLTAFTLVPIGATTITNTGLDLGPLRGRSNDDT